MFTEGMPFEIGKALLMAPGTDVTLFATGHLVWTCIEAAQELDKQGISCEVINIHTIKPLDTEAILKSARKTRAIVVAEEHQRFGGLGEAISSVLAQNEPLPISLVGVNDSFGESGKPTELLEKYGLGKKDVLEAVRAVLSRKK
jgi:transketolase